MTVVSSDPSVQIGYVSENTFVHYQTYRYRLFIDLVLCYKILNGKIDCEPSNTFAINTNTRSRGHPLKLYKRECSCDITKFYFTNHVVNLWNNLLDYVVMSTSVSTCQQRLAKTDLFAR
jgi:hypothetical protein